MKKNSKVITTLVLIFVIVFVAFILLFNDKQENLDNTPKKPKYEDTLSMMIEQTAGTGDYKMEERTSWPTDGYIFNEDLSYCKNGSKISWNDEKGTIRYHGTVTDKCYVYFDKYSAGVVNSFTYTATTSSLTITASATKGSHDISKYLFSIDNGSTYKESTTNTYTFSSLSAGTTYTIKIKVKDSLNKESAVYSGTAKTRNPLLADYIKSKYTSQGTNGLYYHNGSLSNGINDSSYRYAGASSEVNNYVCFGSTTTPCPTDNLYRIIGVFGSQVKLIKSSSLGSMVWDSNNSNTWSTSSLNTYLNGTYLTNLGDSWSNKIATTIWKVGGNTSANISKVVAATTYKNEITSPAVSTTYSAKIGLMYVSDFGFAADQAAWTTTLYNYDVSVNGSTIKSLNWMALGTTEWTISRNSENSNNAFDVGSGGYVGISSNVGSSDAVRPVFYLVSTATYSSGTGTSSDPIRIE